MLESALPFARLVLGTLRDLLPIVLVVVFFQMGVLGQPFPDLENVLIGFVLVMVGLAVFLRGLEMALFPLGEAMAGAFARKGSLFWLLTFAFALGFGTTVAEPALIAVADEAAAAAADSGVIEDEVADRTAYALRLRYIVAISVGIALVIGVTRIVKGWPLPLFIMAGYLLVVALTTVAPEEVVGIAYDSGGVTTSTVTVPLVAALGIGLATVIRGRNPMIDGFGLIAFASLLPIIFVLTYGIMV